MRVDPSPLPSPSPSSLPPTAAGLAGGVERVACFPTHLPRRLWQGGVKEVAVRREQGGAVPRAGEQVPDARMFRAHAAARAAAAGCPVPPTRGRRCGRGRAAGATSNRRILCIVASMPGAVPANAFPDRSARSIGGCCQIWPTGARVRRVRIARAGRPVDPPDRPPHLLRRTERCAAEALRECARGRIAYPPARCAPRRAGAGPRAETAAFSCLWLCPLSGTFWRLCAVFSIFYWFSRSNQA